MPDNSGMWKDDDTFGCSLPFNHYHAGRLLKMTARTFVCRLNVVIAQNINFARCNKRFESC